MSNYPDLVGKVAVITGAGRLNGLGAAMAQRLAAEGVKVVIADLGSAHGDLMPGDAVGNTAEMDAIVADIVAAGGKASAVTCNMLESAQVEALARYAVATYGGLDIWINNAGIGYLMKPIIEMSVEEWDAVLGVNLRGAFLGIKSAAPHMIAGGGGRIINIGSQAAKSAFAHASAYTTSKHGLVGLTRVAAQELGAHGITVNCICPNHITTGLGAWQNEHFAKVGGKSLDRYMADMCARIPLGRPGLQEDVAKACAFLCSDQAGYITGESMNVSGGEEYH
jgi:NAD(P)-dependent dehydrogenase (short-subunit alcohol dehydrogenase family)